MAKKIKLELTVAEARALSRVAGNGWGDGDFADYLGDARKVRSTLDAMEKLSDAIRDAEVKNARPEEAKKRGRA